LLWCDHREALAENFRPMPMRTNLHGRRRRQRIIQVLPAMPLMPAFRRHPEEAAIIGRLVAGYGELEFIYANCLAVVMPPSNSAMRSYFSIRGEAIRLDLARNLMQNAFAVVGLEDKCLSTYSDMKFCHKVRNAYAHCHWADHTSAGLFYVNLESTADRTGYFYRNHKYLHVDVKQLERVEDFFWNTFNRGQHLMMEYRVKTGQSRDNPFEWPKGTTRPNLHNSTETHPSPWLLEPPMPEEEAPAGGDPPRE
jgi:hypothetical protein